jgi:hypothetical protein
MHRQQQGQLARASKRARLDTAQAAIMRATKLTEAEIERHMDPINFVANRIRAGVATAHEHSVVETVFFIAQEIEARGVIRGIAAHIKDALDAMDAIEIRAKASGSWTPVTCTFSEKEAIDLGLELHVFQLQNLSWLELNQAVEKMINRHKSSGGVVERIQPADVMASVLGGA